MRRCTIVGILESSYDRNPRTNPQLPLYAPFPFAPTNSVCRACLSKSTGEKGRSGQEETLVIQTRVAVAVTARSCPKLPAACKRFGIASKMNICSGSAQDPSESYPRPKGQFLT